MKYQSFFITPSAIYNLTTSYAVATGWTLTMPKDGEVLLFANINNYSNESSDISPGYNYFKLYNETKSVTIPHSTNFMQLDAVSLNRNLILPIAITVKYTVKKGETISVYAKKGSSVDSGVIAANLGGFGYIYLD